MKILLTNFLVLITFISLAQNPVLPMEAVSGYYYVGTNPNKPFFLSRWYIRDDQPYFIFDSDIDRKLNLSNEGKAFPTIFLSEEEVPLNYPDSIPYFVFNVKDGLVESFKLRRNRKSWSTDLYGKRIQKWNALAVDTEFELTESITTEHFIIRSSPEDYSYAEKFSEKLESRYQELSELFGVEMKQTTIFIYPDHDTYHNAVLSPGAPAWQMGKAWTKNEIRMVSPRIVEKNEGLPFSEDLVVHEYIHCIHWTMIGNTRNLKQWLWEGVAMYKGCCAFVTPSELDYLKKGKRPSLKKIESHAEMKYDLGYYLVEFIDVKWGWNTVLKLITSNGDLEKCLGMSSKEFEKAFYQHLESNYLK